MDEMFREPPRLKVILLLSLAGGFVSVLGSFLIIIGLMNLLGLGHSYTPPPVPWYQKFLSPEAGLNFLAGVISVGIVAPFFVSRILATRESDRRRTIWGVIFGALAGVGNVVILTSMHISTMAPLFHENRMIGTLIGLSIYVPTALILYGLPAAIMGGLVGILAGSILRKFILPNQSHVM